LVLEDLTHNFSVLEVDLLPLAPLLQEELVPPPLLPLLVRMLPLLPPPPLVVVLPPLLPPPVVPDWV
jgi:hypothetical protein